MDAIARLMGLRASLKSRPIGADVHGVLIRCVLLTSNRRHTSKLQQLSRSILTPYIQFNGEIAQADYRGSVSEIENTLPSGFGIIEGPTLRNSHGELVRALHPPIFPGLIQ